MQGSSLRPMPHRTIPLTVQLREHPLIACCENRCRDVRMAGSAPPGGKTQPPSRPHSFCTSLRPGSVQLLRGRFNYRTPWCSTGPRHSRIALGYYTRVASHTGEASHPKVDTLGIEPRASHTAGVIPLHHVPICLHPCPAPARAGTDGARLDCHP
jgi:hypothetical protein